MTFTLSSTVAKFVSFFRWTVTREIKNLVIKVCFNNYCHETNLIKMVVRHFRWVVFCWSATAHCPFFSYLRFLWVCESSRRRPVHRHMAWITWRNVLVFFNTYKHRISRTHIRDFISCLLLSFFAAIVDERHHWTCDGANTCATLNNRPPVWSRLPWHLSS